MATNHPYARDFERFSASLPSSERAVREAAFAEFQARGLPGKREEDWRYTDLAALNDRAYALSKTPASSVSFDSISGTEQSIFVDGQPLSNAGRAPVSSSHLSAQRLPLQTADGIDHLNAAFASEGLNLEIPANTQQAKPLHLLLVGQASGTPAMSHQRHRIALGEHAEAAIIIELFGQEDGDRFSTQVIDIDLAANAKLDLYRLQRERSGTTLLTRVDARLARDSRLHAVCLDGGNGVARHDFNIALQGPGAEATIDSLAIAHQGAHVDNHTRVIHEQPQGRSRAHFRSMVHERARAVIDGKVIVRPGAQKTDSELRIASLLLSRRAEVNAKPDLEIYADDVKCAHGLTVGQLDEVALEYLRSRGIAEPEARALLLRAFVAATLESIFFPPLRHYVEAALGLTSDVGEFTDEIPE